MLGSGGNRLAWGNALMTTSKTLEEKDEKQNNTLKPESIRLENHKTPSLQKIEQREHWTSNL
jgi:hypothetical protein